MIRILGFLASMLVPSVTFAVVYAAQGQNPVFGLVAGMIGLLGALAYEIVHLSTARWSAERELAAELRRPVTEDPPDK